MQKEKKKGILRRGCITKEEISIIWNTGLIMLPRKPQSSIAEWVE